MSIDIRKIKIQFIKVKNTQKNLGNVLTQALNNDIITKAA